MSWLVFTLNSSWKGNLSALKDHSRMIETKWKAKWHRQFWNGEGAAQGQEKYNLHNSVKRRWLCVCVCIREIEKHFTILRFNSRNYYTSLLKWAVPFWDAFKRRTHGSIREQTVCWPCCEWLLAILLLLKWIVMLLQWFLEHAFFARQPASIFHLAAETTVDSAASCEELQEAKHEQV